MSIPATRRLKRRWHPASLPSPAPAFRRCLGAGCAFTKSLIPMVRRKISGSDGKICYNALALPYLLSRISSPVSSNAVFLSVRTPRREEEERRWRMQTTLVAYRAASLPSVLLPFSTANLQITIPGCMEGERFGWHRLVRCSRQRRTPCYYLAAMDLRQYLKRDKLSQYAATRRLTQLCRPR